MAEGFLKSFNKDLEVYSAGTSPSGRVHPKAIQVMDEIGVDISDGYPQHVDEFLEMDFDYVISVCGGAKESCPTFTGKVKQNLHIGFDDPAAATGSEQKVLAVFRRVRDEIKRDFLDLYENKIKK
jgi:arsenate reductase